MAYIGNSVYAYFYGDQAQQLLAELSPPGAMITGNLVVLSTETQLLAMLGIIRLKGHQIIREDHQLHAYTIE